jgi:GNAT superfamily N-acetyltransferase
MGKGLMNSSEYRIRLYQHDWIDNVVDLLRFLIGDDRDENLLYFKWKYYDNPYAEGPLGVVALHGDEIVGFRGYFPSRWTTGDGGCDVVILVPGDTCVHPDHRRKGLSIAMGNMAMASFHSKYRMLLNLSANGNSVPGYLKMGFVPLMTKRYLSRYSLPGLARFVLKRRRPEGFPPPRLRTGKYGDVEVSLIPKPEEMASLSAPLPSAPTGPRFSLFKDRAYFRWRYRNKRNRYVFYFSHKAGSVRAYLAVRVHRNNRRAYIVDYGARREEDLIPILRHITARQTFDILSIYDLDIEQGISGLLASFSFRRHGLLRLLEKKAVGDLPVLTRPVKPDFQESDWFLCGIDTRRRASWQIREICSDGA